DRQRELAQHRGGARDLADRFLLHPQAGEDRRGHRRGDLAAHDHAHQVDHLVVEDLAMLDRALQRLLGRDGHGRGLTWSDQESRKFFSNACPCSVRIDSGWNCTPCTGCSRWRKPMISSMEPSSWSVHAVTSRQSGSVSWETTSEW